jgi:hypothetical protein
MEALKVGKYSRVSQVKAFLIFAIKWKCYQATLELCLFVSVDSRKEIC